MGAPSANHARHPRPPAICPLPRSALPPYPCSMSNHDQNRPECPPRPPGLPRTDQRPAAVESAMPPMRGIASFGPMQHNPFSLRIASRESLRNNATQLGSSYDRLYTTLKQPRLSPKLDRPSQIEVVSTVLQNFAPELNSIAPRPPFALSSVEGPRPSSPVRPELRRRAAPPIPFALSLSKGRAAHPVRPEPVEGPPHSDSLSTNDPIARPPFPAKLPKKPSSQSRFPAGACARKRLH